MGWLSITETRPLADWYDLNLKPHSGKVRLMTEMQKVVIVGTGGHAKVVADTIRLEGKFDLVGFANEESNINEFLACPVRPSVEAFQVSHFIVAVGANHVRAKIFEDCLKRGLQAVSTIHPSAILAPSVVIEAGTLVAAGAILNPFAKVGSNSIINTGTVIEHDCMIGRHVHVAPGSKLAGNVSVGDCAFLGIGTIVIPQIMIGEFSTVGAGSVVIRDVSPRTTVVGSPAKILERGRSFKI